MYKERGPAVWGRCGVRGCCSEETVLLLLVVLCCWGSEYNRGLVVVVVVAWEVRGWADVGRGGAGVITELVPSGELC